MHSHHGNIEAPSKQLTARGHRPKVKSSQLHEELAGAHSALQRTLDRKLDKGQSTHHTTTLVSYSAGPCPRKCHQQL